MGKTPTGPNTGGPAATQRFQASTDKLGSPKMLTDTADTPCSKNLLYPRTVSAAQDYCALMEDVAGYMERPRWSASLWKTNNDRQPSSCTANITCVQDQITTPVRLCLVCWSVINILL